MYKKFLSAVIAIVTVAGTGIYSTGTEIYNTGMQSKAISYEEAMAQAEAGFIGGLKYEEYDDHAVVIEYWKTNDLMVPFGYGFTVLDEVHGLPVTGIADKTFTGCFYLEIVNLPDTLETIGSYAFAACMELPEVDIPDSVVSIGEGAFADCTNLAKVSLSNSLSEIKDETFMRCESLNEITIPESVSSIGKSAFYDCTSLKKVVILNPECEIDESCFKMEVYNNDFDGVICGYENSTAQKFAEEHGYMFSVLKNEGTRGVYRNLTYNKYKDHVTIIDCDDSEDSGFSVTVVDVPDEIEGLPVTEIADLAFSNCPNLTRINIPYSVEKIGIAAFSGCTNVTRIDIPDSVASIGEMAFSECYKLTQITLPGRLSELKDYTFTACSSLKEITVPENVTSIGTGVFSDCSRLAKVTILEPECKIDNDCFRIEGYPADYNGVICGYKKSSAQDFAEKNKYKFEAVSETSPIGNEGYLKYRKYEDHVAILECENTKVDPHMLSRIAIPEKIAGLPVTVIGNNSFDNCNDTKIIDIPESVEIIGDYAFSDCNILTTVNIPDSVVSIGTGAFSGCINLNEISIPESVSEIKDYTFFDCIDLTEITIPENVSSVGKAAFYSCRSLSKVTILDPECKLDYDCFAPEDDDIADFHGVIYGYKNSTAQKLAEERGYEFVSIGSFSELICDVNCDGEVTLADATAILQYLGNRDKYPLSAQGKKNADVVAPEGITSTDAVAIQRLVTAVK